jgi:hypothetical protein
MKPELRKNKTIVSFIKSIQNRSNKTAGYKALT